VTQTPESAPLEDPPPADALNALLVAKQTHPGPTPAFAAPDRNRPPDLEDLDEHLRAPGAPQAPSTSLQGPQPPPQAPTPRQPLASPQQPPQPQHALTPTQPVAPSQQQPSPEPQATATQRPGAPQEQQRLASSQPQLGAPQQPAPPSLTTPPAAPQQHDSASPASVSPGGDVIASPMARAARQLLWRAKMGQKPVVALWLTPTAEGCQLSSDIYPIKSLRVDPEHAGPYRFTNTEDAHAFAQEAARAPGL